MVRKSFTFWFVNIAVFVLACQGYASAQASLCQRVVGSQTRCPYCAEYAPTLTCLNDSISTACCDNLGERVDCSEGCGSVMMTTVDPFGCDGHHRCLQARLQYRELLRNGELAPFRARIFVPDCEGGFTSLEEIRRSDMVKSPSPS